MGFLDSIKESFVNMLKSRQLMIDEALAKISDPFAKEISWEPLVRGGASFKTSNLVSNSFGNLEYKPSTGAKIFSGIFMIIPLIVLLVTFGILLTGITDYKGIDFLTILPILGVSLIFGGVGFYMFKAYGKPIVFDRSIGYFYKGKPTMNLGMIDVNDKKLVPLSSIYAIQIISEHVSGSKSSYYSYEINLVLNDKTRVNVVDFGNLKVIKEDAQKIGEYLGVPVWDLSELGKSSGFNIDFGGGNDV